MQAIFMPFVSVLACAILIGPPTIAAEEHEADHQALRALRDKAAASINSQDIKTLASCFAKEFAFTTVDQTVLTNETQLISFYERMFHGPNAIVESMKIEPKADVRTRFLGDNVGYCFGTSVETYTLKGGNVTVWTNRWTALVVKEDGQWKAAHLHAGANFLDNPLLTRLKSFGQNLAMGTAVGGLFVGALVGLLLRRRKN